MSNTESTRDGFLRVADVNPGPDGAARVTIVEMIGERGYLDRRMSAARALAKRAVYMTGPTKADPVRFCGGQGRVTIEVRPADATESLDSDGNVVGEIYLSE